MKIVALDVLSLSFSPEEWEPLRQLGELTLYDETPYTTEAIVERASEAEAILLSKVPLTAETLWALPKLRYVGVYATGFNIVDVAAARERGMTVTNVPAYSTNSTAQHAVALLLELCNNCGLHSDSVHAGDWTRAETFCYWKKPLVELSGLKVGIIGWGLIGSRVGEILHAFGAEILAYSRSRRNAPTWGPFQWMEMEEIFREADAVSLHCPQTPGNTGFINAELLQRMKRTAFLVNAARGGLVNEADLAAALREGVIAGAAADVVSKEPMQADNPLLGAPNLILTPHVAWSSAPAREVLLRETVANLVAFQKGEARNVVN